jgi:hypothetical protein
LLLCLIWTVSITTTTAEDVPSLLRASSSSGNSNNNNSNNNNRHHHASSKQHNAKSSPPQQVFLDWCQKVMGISTTYLTIQTFEYYDYMKALAERTDQFSEDVWDVNDDQLVEETTPIVADYPMIKVRGLAAAQDIQSGQVLIRIPYNALLTVPNAIDRDPVLSQVLGKQARRQYGWNNNGESGSDSDVDASDTVQYYYELPLLAVALLHHLSLGEASPLLPYIHVLQSSPVDNIPHLWNKQRLQLDANEGVRRVARGIQRDVREMYTAVVQVLVDDHPHLFADPAARASLNDDEYENAYNDEGGDDDTEWMFSFEKFQWAFALVNSRHFHLPIPKQKQKQPTTTKSESESQPTAPSPVAVPELPSPTISLESPPAAMPTDEWLAQQNKQQQREEKLAEDDEMKVNNNNNNNNNDDKVNDDDENGNVPQEWQMGNSFLAPVADLLNFGPPCTRGVYNGETQSFDILATCNFTKGQEVTFWYSDACDEIIMGNYGFTHPMVPKCPTMEDWKRHAEHVKMQALELQEQLAYAYHDLDRIDSELERVKDVLDKCSSSCCHDPQQDATPAPRKSQKGRTTHAHIRGLTFHDHLMRGNQDHLHKKVAAAPKSDMGL